MSTKAAIAIPPPTGDVLLIVLAREIAMDQHDLDQILARNGVKQSEFNKISKNPRFQQLLQQEVSNWNSATNTSERVKIKAAAMIEEWLPEAYRQMHSAEAPLSAKTALAQFIGRLGGYEKGMLEGSSVGERFSVTINLGADQQINFSKELPTKVIEATPND